MRAFVAGAVLGAAGVVAWRARKQLADAPRAWREEPDENLRPTVALVRRVVRKVTGKTGDQS